MKTHVGILGLGEFGSALEHALKKNTSLNITGWDKNADKRGNQPTLDAFVPRCRVVFLAVPMWCMRNALASAAHLLSPSAIIVGCAKGLEKETCKTFPLLAASMLPPHTHICQLAGPMLAEEIAADVPTVGVVASKNAPSSKRVASLFVGTNVSLRTHRDIHGIAYAAVLKNIFTLGLGMADALSYGTNVRGTLIADAHTEMRTLLRMLGAKSDTACTLAGLGDLVTTSTGMRSQNYAAGVEIAKTKRCTTPSEGLNALACFPKLIDGELAHTPFLALLVDVCRGTIDAKNAFTSYFSTERM